MDIDTPDLVPPWKLPEPVPLRTRGPLIQMEAVSFAYPGASRDILRGITLCIEQVTLSAVKSIRNAFVAAVQPRDTLQILTCKFFFFGKPAHWSHEASGCICDGWGQESACDNMMSLVQSSQRSFLAMLRVRRLGSWVQMGKANPPW